MLIKKIFFNCYIWDIIAVMILLSKINCRDRHILLIKLKHTATSNIYREKYLLENKDLIQLFYKELKKPAK